MTLPAADGRWPPGDGRFVIWSSPYLDIMERKTTKIEKGTPWMATSMIHDLDWPRRL